MTVQNISNQPNFTGKLIYVDKFGKEHKNVEKFFSPILEKELKQLKNLIKNKKYNLYISHSKKFPTNIEFNANYNLHNIKSNNFDKRAISILAEKPSLYKTAAQSAMEDFENTHLYKKPNPYRKILNFFI